MLRTLLFSLTNISIVFMLGVILTITGIKSQSLYGILIYALIFGFFSSIISLFISKWVAMHSVNAQIIQPQRSAIEEWLLETVRKQSKKAKINLPEIAIYSSLDMNAFATGATKNSSLIAVSTGLIKNMSKNEIEAVLAHEISHISNGDMVTMTMLQGVINTFVIFVSKLIAQFVSKIFSSNNNEEENNFFSIDHIHNFIYSILSMILELTLGLIASMIILWFSRKREFCADKDAIYLSSKDNMIAALEKLKKSHEIEISSAMSAFCINNKQNNNFFSSKLFMSHPSLSERIQALKELL
ncbi:Protease HtpX [Buchnera aphidicola (Thelaxes suberi)]|uniref:protease HtpX n=1 Tax=Buchnera aphidicola TaxID=9 RepID=UPI003464DB1C